METSKWVTVVAQWFTPQNCQRLRIPNKIWAACWHMAGDRLSAIHESCPQMRLQLTRTPSENPHMSWID